MNTLEYRNPRVMRVYGVVFGIVWCGLLVANIIGASVARSWAAVPVGLLMLAWGAFFITRMPRLAVIAQGDELVVRNMWRTRRIPRDEIQDFRIGNPGLLRPFGKTLHVLVGENSVV